MVKKKITPYGALGNRLEFCSLYNTAGGNMAIVRLFLESPIMVGVGSTTYVISNTRRGVAQSDMNDYLKKESERNKLKE